MKYIVAITRTEFHRNATVPVILKGLDGVESLYEINPLCSLIETNLSPNEILPYMRKTFDGTVAIFMVGSPFTLESNNRENPIELRLRERLYQEEIADLKARIERRGL